MAAVEFNFKASGELARKLKKLGASTSFIANVCAKSLNESFEAIMAESKEKYCPIDTGALRSTGHVIPPKITGGDITLDLVYGGPAAPYATAVHETNKHYHHGKQWKYLETPLKAGIAPTQDKLATDLNAALEAL